LINVPVPEKVFRKKRASKGKKVMEGKGKVEVSQLAISLPQTLSTIRTEKGAAED